MKMITNMEKSRDSACVSESENQNEHEHEKGG